MLEIKEMSKAEKQAHEWVLINRAKQLMKEKKLWEARIVLMQTEGVQEMLADLAFPMMNLIEEVDENE